MMLYHILTFAALFCIEFGVAVVQHRTVFIASDHRGFKFKSDLLNLIKASNADIFVKDLGPFSEESTDYTLKASEVVQRVVEYKIGHSEETSLPLYQETVIGVLICMDGMGMDIAANYFGFPHKLFTANCRTEKDAETAREHNDAIILALGSENESMTPELAFKMIKIFLSTRFLGDVDPVANARHIKRLSNITRFVDSQLSAATADDVMEMSVDLDTRALSDSSATLSHSSTYLSLVTKVIEDSHPSGPYPCSEPDQKCCGLKWRPYRDGVGETRVTSFRTAITAFWSRILGIPDEEEEGIARALYGKVALKSILLDTFKNLFIERIQPFIIKSWKLEPTWTKVDAQRVQKYVASILKTKYSQTIEILRSSSGSKRFFGRFTNDPQEIRSLEDEHLPYIAFMAEEILYPISSYTDHGFLCYAYLNQRLVLSQQHDKVLYDAHIKFTLAIHRALMLLKLADINALADKVPEEDHCHNFYYRTLTIPGGENGFDVDQLRLSLQNTSFSTHPIGALLVFQTVWCIRLRDGEELQRVMLINPADARLSRVSGLSKHPSEFEVMVPAFSESIISPDPNLLYANNLGWTEMIRAFRSLVLPDVVDARLVDLLAECDAGMVRFVLSTDGLHEHDRDWYWKNVPDYSTTARCMYSKLSALASNSSNLAKHFLPEIDKQALKNLRVKNRAGEEKSFWSELERQFAQAYKASRLLRQQVPEGGQEAYLVEYAAALCSELWWFGLRFVDDTLKRRSIFTRQVTMLPDYYYAVIFSFGIIIPLQTSEDECSHHYSFALTKIAEGTTSLIGMDPDGWIWKLYKEENACTEPACPCDKRDNFNGAKHEYEISSVIHMNNSRQAQSFVEDHFTEAVFAGEGHFSMIKNGSEAVAFLKMKETKGETFAQFVVTNRNNLLECDRFVEAMTRYFAQGLEILEFLKSKQIVHMDFHESNAIINVNPMTGKESIVLIDFGLAECYDSAAHQHGLALLTEKSYLPTFGKGRFPVSELFRNDPLYVHDLQIFAVRVIENGLLGMSSRLSNIFDRRKVITREFPRFGQYLSFVKDILEAELAQVPSFLEEISLALLRQSEMLGCSTGVEADKILLDSFSYQLYLNMKNALKILDRPDLKGFFNAWIKTYFIDRPDVIGIEDERDFPTSLDLLSALRSTNEQQENVLLSALKKRIGTFVSNCEQSFEHLKASYSRLLDREPLLPEKIKRITAQLQRIRKIEVAGSKDKIRADPLPRAFVSCQGSYNPPTKAHLFLAHEGRKAALKLYQARHPEDSGLVECNERNVFGILSTIATFEVMEKDFPEQCFTVEERQGFLRHLTGTKLVDFVSGQSPYDQYKDWSWLLLDYSGHSGMEIKNSSRFLAEAETIDLLFLIAFIPDDQYSQPIALKRQELMKKYGGQASEFVKAHEALVESELLLRQSMDLKRLNLSTSTSIDKNRLNGLFLNAEHQAHVEQIFKEILIDAYRVESKGNARLFAISGEPRNSNNKGLYLGMSDKCPRDFKSESGSSFNVSSTKIRRFLAQGAGKEALAFLEDSVAERINHLNFLFRLVGSFVPESGEEFVAEFFGRNYFVEHGTVMKYAPPKLSEIPLKKTVFREAYTAPPIKVEKLTMFMEFEDPENLAVSPFYITGVLELKWNAEAYPEGHVNLSDLLELDGRQEFVQLLSVQVLDDFSLEAKFSFTKDKIIFHDSFIRELLDASRGGKFKMLIKAKVCALGKNRSGRGFYLSGQRREESIALTLMEPFGFSHLFFMQDRPDVLALYDVILIGYGERPFTLLAGGEWEQVRLDDYLKESNLQGLINADDSEVLLISDKHPKPTYLFQCIFLPYECESQLLANGKMRKTSCKSTQIRLIREVSGTYDDTSFALDALKKVMCFDESFSGCCYDSANLTLVAATDFNSGAREMRNFMIFSPSKLLANRSISTIDDFYNVERIVAHEYLHHVSGNRVTMRDFFEVTLKEGSTVLRDMYFRENSGIFGTCSRLEAVTKLRKTQWVQDSGPKAHSVRPAYIDHKGDFEVSLFTTTVYEKGAEIMRMIQELLGVDSESFSKLMHEKFLSGPIRASTVGEFVDSFDLEARLSSAAWFSKPQFMKWFSVKGTPSVTVSWNRQDRNNVYELVLEQVTSNGATDEVEKEMLIPIRIAFFDGVSGRELSSFDVIDGVGLHYVKKDLFVLNKSEGRLRIAFHSNCSSVVPSLNRGFSAPIKLEYQTPYHAAFLAKYETDQMARFDAIQFLIKSAIIEKYHGKSVDQLIEELFGLIRFRLQKITASSEHDIFTLWTLSRASNEHEEALLELALSIEEMYLSNLVDDFVGHVDPLKLSKAREDVQNSLSKAMFAGSAFEADEFIDELDHFKRPGSVKLEQVMLRTFVNSRAFADKLSASSQNPSMERQMALLECRYRLSLDSSDRFNLLSEFNSFIRSTSDSHPVAKEKLFKFIILKSSSAAEMKSLVEKFDLLVPTQPQNLKLFAKEFASNNLAVFHSPEGLRFMAEVIGNCDTYGNQETAATLIKHSFEVNLLKLDDAARQRVAALLEEMFLNPQLSQKLKTAVNGLLKRLKK